MIKAFFTLENHYMDRRKKSFEILDVFLKPDNSLDPNNTIQMRALNLKPLDFFEGQLKITSSLVKIRNNQEIQEHSITTQKASLKDGIKQPVSVFNYVNTVTDELVFHFGEFQVTEIVY